MTTISWIFLIVAGAYALADWFAVRTDDRLLLYVAKPSVMVFLLGVAATLDATDESAQWCFALAVLASLAGDVFLMLPEPGEGGGSGPTSRWEREWFVPGLASFLVAHVLYGAGLLYLGIEPALAVLGAVLGVACIATVGRRIIGAARERAPALGNAVTAYVVVISAMLALAVGSGDGRAVVGALLFVSSDALLGWNRFVAPVTDAPLLIHVTYHLGQAGLVLSLL